MPRTWLHRLVAICLGALYGAVGFTGGSIHYLATDAWGIWSHLRQADSGGYYHVHAPDFHGHYHRHVHHGSHSHDGHPHTAVAIRNDACRSTQGGIHKPSADSHESHSCPLLSLVSTLKLSHAHGCIATIILESIVAPSGEACFIPTFERALAQCPRGPPVGHFA
jgi:hypothetical protein